MKKIFLIFCVLIFTLPLYGDIDNDEVTISYRGKEWGMSFSQFRTLIIAAGVQNELVKAENSKRIKVYLEKKEWSLNSENDFKVNMRIVWFDSKMKPLKILNLEGKLNLKKDNTKKDNKMVLYYKKAASWGFPASVLINIILLMILI